MAAITPYGGVGEIGGNRLLLAVGDASLLLDFGFSFGAEGRFFEEYLQPRGLTKLCDLLELGLVPALDGVYRRDALRPHGLDGVDAPATPLFDREVRSYEAARDAGDWTPDAVVLSHAHLDHAGYLPYLGPMPLLCSPTTETVLDALDDVGNFSGFDGEFLRLQRRYVDELSDRATFPAAPTVRRRDDPVERPVHHLFDRDPVAVPGTDVTVEALDVGHSIPGAIATLVEGAGRQVLYTGDVRFHGRDGVDLRDELAGLRPDLMLCEGTRIDDDEPDDEVRVEDDLAEVFAGTEGLAMVGFGWKDLERYETVRRAAERAGRVPVFDPRLAYLQARVNGSIYEDGCAVFVERTRNMLYSPGDYVYAKHKASDEPLDAWEDDAPTTHLDDGVTAVDLRERPEEYVLHLDYYRFRNLVDIKPPEGSTFVRARTEPFNVDMELSETRQRNWLARFGVNEGVDHEPIYVHASGHAAGPEIQELVDVVEPARLVPIHTEHPGAFENPAGEVIEPVVGERIRF